LKPEHFQVAGGFKKWFKIESMDGTLTKIRETNTYKVGKYRK